MAINFPNSPSLGQLYNFSGTTWQWSGEYWNVYSAQTGYITSVTSSGNGYPVIDSVGSNSLSLKSFSGTNVTITDTGSELVFSADGIQNLITVGTGGNVNFTSVKSAVDSITNSSESNRFVIQVGPGVFYENEIDLSSKPYVSIIGSTIETTKIVAATSTQNIFKIGFYNEISFMTLSGASLGYAAIVCDDAGIYSLAHKISTYDCDTNVLVTSSSQDTQFYGEYMDFNGEYTYGVKTVATNGYESLANMESCYNFPSGTGSTIGIFAQGSGATLNLFLTSHIGNGVSGSTAIVLEDYANLVATSLNIDGWDYGIRVLNVGGGSTFDIDGASTMNCSSYNLSVEQSSASGTYQGSSSHEKIYNISQNVYWSFLDSDDGEFDVTRKISVTFQDGSHTDLSTLLFEGSGMGLLDGGTITTVSGTTISVSQGYGYLEKYPPDVSIIKRINWNNSQLTLPINSDQYIYFNNSGILSNSGSLPNTTYNILLGRVVTSSTGVRLIDASPLNANHISNNLSIFNRNALGPVYSSGSLVTQNTTPFRLNVSSGVYYFSENEFTPSGGTIINFTQYYRDGVGGWNTSATTVVNNTSYDGNGSLSALTASAFTKHTLYVVGDGVNEKYFLVLGQAQYTNLVDAEGADLPTPPTYFSDSVTPIASIYIQQGLSGITRIEDIRPVIGFKAAGVSATALHANLLGLSADDHTQYLLVNGNRAMSGNLDMGSNNITSAGTINNVTIQTHASRHQHGGADEVATSTPGANAIPKADTNGYLNSWISDASTSSKGLVRLSSTPLSPSTPIAVSESDARFLNSISGVSYSNNTLTFRNVSGGTNTVTINNLSGLTINGNLTVTGDTSLQSLTATTISATTYNNLPNTLYTGDGSITSNRTVNQSGFSLTFTGTSASRLSIRTKFAQGNNTFADGLFSHAEGLDSVTSQFAPYTHAEGVQTLANSLGSHAEGVGTVSSGLYSHTEGENTDTYGRASHAEGYTTEAQGNYSHAEGYQTDSIGNNSHSEGEWTQSSGISSHSEGYYTYANNNYSHSEGVGYIVDPSNCLSIGEPLTYVEFSVGPIVFSSNTFVYINDNTIATLSGFDLSGITIGSQLDSLQFNSFKVNTCYYSPSINDIYFDCYLNEWGQEVCYTYITFNPNFSQFCSVTGCTNTADGIGSHVEGLWTDANGNFSHAEGIGTIANGEGQHVSGKYNLTGNTSSLFVIGNGTDDDNRSDILNVNQNEVLVFGGLSADTISASTYYNLPVSTLTEGSNISITGSNGNFTVSFTGTTGSNFTGGTVTGATNFTNGLTATTISATTYQNLPTDVRVTGATYSNNTFTYTNNTGGTFNVLFNTLTGLTVNGNLTVTGNTSLRALTATTISATTYTNLPNTLYTGDGSLSSTRTVNLNDKNLTFSSTTNANVMTLRNGGDVIIGSTSTTNSLYVQSSSDPVTFENIRNQNENRFIVSNTVGTLYYRTDVLTTSSTINAATGGTYNSSTGIISLSGTGSLGTISLGTNFVTAVTESANVITFTRNGGSPTTVGTIDAVTGGSYSSGTITLVGTGAIGTTITGIPQGTVTSVGLSLGTTGSDLNIGGGTSPVTSSGTITLNVPDASATARGVVTTGTQTFAGAKTFSTAPILSSLSASQILALDASGNIQSLTTGTYPSLTELSYVKGVTSAIQTQLTNKQASSTNLTSLSNLSYVSSSFVKMTGANTFTLDTNTYLTSAVTATTLTSANVLTVTSTNGSPGTTSVVAVTGGSYSSGTITLVGTGAIGTTITGFPVKSINTVSTNTTGGTNSNTDYIYLVSGTTTVTLPSALGNTNIYTIKRIGTNTVTINTTSSQTIDGSLTASLNVQYQSLSLVSDGSNWNII